LADTFFLEILVPDRKFYSGDVQMLTLKACEGEIGVLPGHMPLVSTVSIGPIHIKKDGEWQEAFLSEGFIEILPEKVVIIADSAEWPHEIDENRAKAAEERARERLQGKLSRMEYVRSQAALARAASRLKVSRESKNQ
jgi:F-type H+-transporting ATPase subunit epsilon